MTESSHERPNKPLAYRLRRSVRYHNRNGCPVLILHFPLKAIILDSFSSLIFEHLSTGDFIPFERIVSSVNDADPGRVEIFLNSLVRKGFLEQEGFLIPPEYPSVSIIIPVRNRPEEIGTCLESMSQIDYPPDKLEITVVDDASDDTTSEVVSRFPVRLISLKEHRQASFCRNLAAQRANGEILAFIDSDCLADPLWLRELVPAFKDPAVGAVGGLVDSYFREKGLDHYERVKSSLNMGPRFKSSIEGDLFLYAPSCNLLVRRAVFLKVGGFENDMHVGEDVDLCWRLQDEGYHVEYRPVGKVLHKHRNRLRPFCARRFDYGTSEPLLQRVHARRIKHLFFPPGVSLFWGLVVLSTILQSFTLLCLSGIIVLITSLGKFTKTRSRDLPIELPNLFLAVFRSYFAFFYHFCAFVSRYYLFWSIVIFPLMPLASVVIIAMHLLTGVVEYSIKKPRLNPLLFLFYFSLDQLFYQFGVWWGCLKYFYFRPVNPKIVANLTSKEV